MDMRGSCSIENFDPMGVHTAIVTSRPRNAHGQRNIRDARRRVRVIRESASRPGGSKNFNVL